MLCTILSLTGVTLAKYVTELVVDDAKLTMRNFYFRSPVLKESEDFTALTPIEVHGTSTTFSISNGANAIAFSDMDIAYTLQYYVLIEGEWVATLASPQSFELKKESALTTQTHTLTPISYEGMVYNDIIVEATATTPYAKTLCARIQFEYQPHKISYQYYQEFGAIELQVSTNADAGEYYLNWFYPLIPDNADPNGILTNALAAPNDQTGLSLTMNLQAHTTYRLYFFIAAEMRSYVDSEVSNMSNSEILALIQTVLKFEKI